MVRSVVGIVLGVLLWMFGFYALAIGLSMVWPDYAVHGRQFVREGVFTFTALMACCNVLLWIVAGIAAGWVGAKIAKRRAAVWVLAGLLGIYLAVLHLVLYWARFPWWYNLAVVLTCVPAVLWGARLANPVVATER
jgi:hypothetical protein